MDNEEKDIRITERGQEDPINRENNGIHCVGGSIGIAELVYGVLFTPSTTFRRIAGEPPLFYSFIVFLVVVTLTSLVSSLAPPELPGVPPGFAEAIVSARPLIGIVGALVAFVGWFVQAGILQVFAEMFSGKGRALAVLAVIALADIPRVLVIPFQIISYFTADSFLGPFFTVAASLIVLIWSLVLMVIGLREVHVFSTGRAVATMLVPLGIIVLVAVTIMITFVGMMAPLFPGE